ncbi:2-phosphosulfolactate phosphatase [Alteribacter populi]|uniref:2-phosphosulfolactate phosphatase n=1 Tax=Alteribacter populi TaxID=2011011 RepID=UPI000BBAC9E0|nr:2-phosphosulfolactate phosphatase [Alteribacter populi]
MTKVHFEWGKRGTREAAGRGDITIIVDVLSFSSTVVSALACGAEILPYPPYLDGMAYANKQGAELILGRAEAASLDKPTLSPVTFNEEHRGKKYVLCSLNGAVCTWVASQVPYVFVGSLLNALSIADAVNILAGKENVGVTVVACGEQWSDIHEQEDRLRPSLEDYLGAGAIIAQLNGRKSPDAKVCEIAFEGVKGQVEELIWNCESGVELRERGYERDVKHCSQLDMSTVVPQLKEGVFVSVPGA